MANSPANTKVRASTCALCGFGGLRFASVNLLTVGGDILRLLHQHTFLQYR